MVPTSKSSFSIEVKKLCEIRMNPFHCFIHSHKKRKDSLETRAVLLTFFLELGISGVAVQSIHQNSEKW